MEITAAQAQDSINTELRIAKPGTPIRNAYCAIGRAQGLNRAYFAVGVIDYKQYSENCTRIMSAIESSP